MMTIVAVAGVLASQSAQAQTWTVLHDFTGGPDGGAPYAGLTFDRAGNLYGTASTGGNSGGPPCYSGCGLVFKLTHTSDGWTLNPIYKFSGPDGMAPEARVIFGPDGSLYGTTFIGGDANKGVVFRLQPPLSACKSVLCPWRETVLHSFQGGSDGQGPTYGDLAFDQAGNLYGTTVGAEEPGDYGTVFQLKPSGGGWVYSVIYSFAGGADGSGPYGGVVVDKSGVLYGTTAYGGIGAGTVYALTPSAQGWTKSLVSDFPDFQDGSGPIGGLIMDQFGNLYGTTFLEGQNAGGTAYELSPSPSGWIFTVLYSFSAYDGSTAKPTLDAAGNLYGTLTFADNAVFKLTYSNGHWTQTGFPGGGDQDPTGSVVLDAGGNVYGTTNFGGAHSAGVVFEITP